MTHTELLKQLQKLGTPQNVKVYKRHGMGDNIYGVSFANLNALKKKIKVDHDLAQELWKSGNADARNLALMIADPEKVTEALLDSWVGDLKYYMMCDMFAGFAGKTGWAKKKAEEWIKSPDEWMGRAGWDLVGVLAMRDENLPDNYFEKFLQIIETSIQQSKNFTRHAMNNALIAIGMRNPNLEKLAIAAAKRIGKVVVDHGETGCKTPNAAEYISKVKARRKKK